MLLHETGVANSVDPLGGSYLLESLTSDLEREAYEYFARIDDLGGMIPALEGGFPQREIAEAAYRFERELADGQRTIVGVNDFELDEPLEIPILQFDPEGEARHLERLERVRSERDAAAAESALARLAEACADPDENTMPYLLDAANAYCTLGEITRRSGPSSRCEPGVGFTRRTISRTDAASCSPLNGVYVVSATSAPPASQYSIGVQPASGIASISRRMLGCWRIVIEKRTPSLRQTATTA